ncbi:MAG: LamG domain-containing protein [Parabacteroides sp.]|nr:LamG domain-containing protein [Parabacteroides sp.]
MKRNLMGESGLDKHTMLLLHFDGTLKDEVTGKYCTNHNTTFSDGKFGKGLDVNNGSYISLEGLSDYYPGTDDFTIDFWIKVRGNNSYYPAVYGSNYRSDNGFLIITRHRDDHPNGWWIASTTADGAVFNKAIKSSTISANNTETHFALTRKSGTFYLWLNGMLNTTKPSYFNITCPINKMTIGNFIVDNNSWANAIISEFRVSNIARWTSNFNVPIKPY